MAKIGEKQIVSGVKADAGVVSKKTAYETAVAYGFSGSESEWLQSLKGARGDRGIDGTNGRDGRDGIDGRDGVNGLSAYEIAVKHGFQGSEVEWLASLRGQQGDIGIQGEPGPKGNTGSMGPKGDMGRSPYALAVQYGFHGTEEQWVALQVNMATELQELKARVDSLQK